MSTTKKNRPKFDLLREAYKIIDAIPGRAFDLEMFITKMGEAPSCGTIACAGGYLAMNPFFKKRGLKLVVADECYYGGYTVQYRGNNGLYAFAKLFKLHESDSNGDDERDVFAARDHGYKDYELSNDQLDDLSDKALWKRRVLRLFQEYGEPFDRALGKHLYLSVR